MGGIVPAGHTCHRIFADVGSFCGVPALGKVADRLAVQLERMHIIDYCADSITGRISSPILDLGFRHQPKSHFLDDFDLAAMGLINGPVCSESHVVTISRIQVWPKGLTYHHHFSCRPTSAALFRVGL